MGKNKVKPSLGIIGDHWGRSWGGEHIYIYTFRIYTYVFITNIECKM